MEAIKFADFFCGAGGLSSGLIMSGMKCILGVDNDKIALKTFKKNHLSANTFCGNIQEIDEAKIKELFNDDMPDVLAFGVPCQAFSTIGKNDIEDKRRNLFYESMRIVNMVKPKAVLMENVTGITSAKNRIILETIFREFDVEGYNVDAKVLSAQDFGVPQVRRRTFIIAIRKDVGVPTFPVPTHGTKIPYVTVGETFSRMQSNLKNHDLNKAKVKNYREEEILARVPMGRSIRYKKDVESLLPPELRPKIDWEKLPEGRLRQERYKRLDFNKLSPTILTSKSTYYHPKENRYLTAREAACLQSFPSYFEFEGSTTAQWRQIGNAVPPRLASYVGQAILRSLNKGISIEEHNKNIDEIFGGFKKVFFYSRKKKIK